MNLSDICTREVVMIDCAATLQQAATLMRERHVGMLLVTTGSAESLQLAGIVTDRDVVVEAVARGLDATRTEIGTLASRGVAALPAGATIGQAVALMKERGVRRLLVSGEGGTLYGIVSLDDLLAALGHEMAELAHALHQGIENESAERGPLAAASPAQRPLHIPAYAFT